jgi:D-beta-D-heptose 7-phosphate kinase/D-beta-D-heptose 1-phosphate adenosyltransferase
MSSELTTLVELLGAQRLAVMGSFILDRHCYGDAETISPEAPVPVLRLKHEVPRPGGAGHVASSLAALGCEVHCCGALGDDAAGRQLVELLHQVGVRTQGITLVPDWKTTTHTRLIGLAQHKHPQQMMHVEERSVRSLPVDAVERIGSTVQALADRVDAICIRDSDAEDCPEALCRVAIEAGRRTGRAVLIDPGPPAHCGRYHGATIITPNRAELAELVGEAPDQIQRIGESAKPLVEGLGLSAMIVTLDRDGALVVPAHGEPVHVPTRPRSVYDITGAGNVVLAVLGAAVAAGASLEQAALLANVAAGLSVERFGAVSISRDEIAAELVLDGRAGVGKLRTLDDLIAELSPRRAAGSKVVFTNGCFDVLHAGHVQYFKFCRDHGDIVVVGLNSDASVRAQGKGDDRPINSQLDRARMLSALETVDYVVIFDEPTPENMIRRILPDVLVKGGDWAKWVCGKEIVEAAGGRVLLAPMMEGYSTTQLLDRIRGMEARRERKT